MCGIFGVFGLGSPVDLDDRTACRLRDTMTHRGPDGAGLWRCPWAVLGHRRLAVIAPGPEGAQPMATPDGRFVLAYNGEIYNDAELRTALAAEGVRFRTRCDTETLLWALARWGERAIARIRGMYAFAFLDTTGRRVLLARDPLGVKPLYAARIPTSTGPQVVFASEPTAVLAHPRMRVEPDLVTLSAYLTTIRPTLGRRTMFAGVETLLPGETRIYDASHDGEPAVRDAWDTPAAGLGDAGRTLAVAADAVRAHLRTDVPMCALLSGGLDSAAIVTLAGRELRVPLRTYCAGARAERFDDDFAHAAAVSGRVGSRHTEVVVDRASFLASWPELVDRTGVPLSTPNEVAIHAVACSLRADGHVVTLSGEGADELFGGYAPPMSQAAAYVASLDGRPDLEGGLFHLLSNAWTPPGAKPDLLAPAVWKACEADAVLADEYQRAFAALRASAPDDSPLQAHLRFHRRVNLSNLLRRLDSTTMLASVESRTPFADDRVARFAESLPMDAKFRPGDPPRTKVALREAFAGLLPQSVVRRPKASFPLPFQDWIGERAAMLRRSSFAREVFTDAAIELVASSPAERWTLAWPMINAAMWGERWWGAGAARPAEPLLAAS